MSRDLKGECELTRQRKGNDTKLEFLKIGMTGKQKVRRIKGNFESVESDGHSGSKRELQNGEKMNWSGDQE